MPVFVTKRARDGIDIERAIAPEQVHVSFEVESAQAAEPRFYGVEQMLELEREQVMPMTMLFDGYVEEADRVRSTCLMSIAKNRYSVPFEMVGQSVNARL